MLNLLLLYILHDKIEDITRVEVIMSRLIQIQHVDTTYDTYNFDDPLSNLSYFKKLYQSSTARPEEEIDEMFNDLMEILMRKTKKYSKNYDVEALHTMRWAAEKTHDLFQGLNRDTYPSMLSLVLDVISAAVGNFGDLLRDSDNGDESQAKYLPVESRF